MTEKAGRMRGKVYLVGAGPGDPELLTLKGKRALEEAELVVYDRLANPRLLDYASTTAERIYVGKEAQRHAMTQEEITALLVREAAAGRVICRLKGGDPFVFGRGGEEAEALTEAGLAWEYVPGVTSAIAVPGYAGIPVTHRGLCSTFAVVTGHEDPTKSESSIRWDDLATGVDTLVFLMGVERLSGIVEKLIEHGRDPETPAAVISWGSYPRQRAIEGNLANISQRCAEAGCVAPAITVVGDVAALRERLRWFDNRPLFGKRIAVTRTAEQASELARRLEAAGAEVLLCPTIRVERIPNLDLSLLETPYDWVVFTSVNGVYSLATALREAGRDMRRLGNAKIAAIGTETGRAAEAMGLHVDFVPSRFVAEQVIAEFPEEVSGKRILIPRAREARELLPEKWREAGAQVDVLPVYETRPDPTGADRLRAALAQGQVDVLTFTASSTVKNLLSSVAPSELANVAIACIGPITAETADQAGLNVTISARIHTIAGLVQELEDFFTISP